MAAAIGSSMRYTFDAPAPSADSRMARRSTWVEPHGTQMMMRGLGEKSRDSSTFLMNCFSICSVTVKSAMTPSFIGPDRGDVARRAAEHLLGRETDFLDHLLAVGTAFLADRDDGGLVQHDALAADVDEGVGGAEVDR